MIDCYRIFVDYCYTLSLYISYCWSLLNWCVTSRAKDFNPWPTPISTTPPCRRTLVLWFLQPFFYFRIYFYDTCYVPRLSSRKKWFSFFIKLYFCLRNYWQLLQCLLSFRISELLSFTWTKCPVSDWLSCTSMWIVWTYNESNQWKIMADRRQYRLQTMTFEIGIENQYSRYRYQDYSGIDWSLVSFFFLISIFLCLYSAILFFLFFYLTPNLHSFFMF